MHDNQITKIFAAIEKLTLDEKRALTSFDKRISFLYDHKSCSRKLIRLLDKAKKQLIVRKIIDKDLLDEIVMVSLKIETGIKKAFYALDPNLFSINEDIDALLQREINTQMSIYKSLEDEPKSSTRERLLKNVEKALAYEKKEEDLAERFNYAIKRFRSLIKDQKRYLQEELALLDEIRSADEFTPIYIDAWMHSIKEFREKIETFLKIEKETVHEAVDPLLRKGKRIYRLVERIKKKGKVSEKDLKRDMQSFSSPAEFQRYQSALMRHPELLTEKAVKILSRGGLLSAAAAERIEISEKEMGEMAKFDRLTGLITRTFFDKKIESLLEHLKREKTPYSVLFMDIDNFKKFNDNYGHDVGDAVLRETSRIIKSMIKRKRDLVIRWGGEEILVMLVDIEKEKAAAIAENIRRNIEERSKILMDRINAGMPNLANKRDRITVSIGVASAPSDGGDIKELIKISDIQLYAAKEGGRNRVAYSS